MEYNQINKKLVKELQNVVDELKKSYRDYPNNLCEIASNAVEERFGFKKVSGLFCIDNGTGLLGYNHCWNKVKNRYIIDLTAVQFKKDLPEVFIIKKNSDAAKQIYEEGVGFIV